jgi:hypothetical protein
MLFNCPIPVCQRILVQVVPHIIRYGHFIISLCISPVEEYQLVKGPAGPGWAADGSSYDSLCISPVEEYQLVKGQAAPGWAADGAAPPTVSLPACSATPATII